MVIIRFDDTHGGTGLIVASDAACRPGRYPTALVSSSGIGAHTINTLLSVGLKNSSDLAKHHSLMPHAIQLAVDKKQAILSPKSFAVAGHIRRRSEYALGKSLLGVLVIRGLRLGRRFECRRAAPS